MGEDGTSAWSPARNVTVSEFNFDSSDISHAAYMDFLNELDVEDAIYIIKSDKIWETPDEV